MQPSPPDLTSLVVALLTLISSKEIAALVGPYVAIVLASSIAAGWALSGVEEELNWKKSARFFLLRILTAVIFTVTIANLIHNAFGSIPISILLIVIAATIGSIESVADLRAKINAGWDWMLKVLPSARNKPDGQ